MFWLPFCCHNNIDSVKFKHVLLLGYLQSVYNFYYCSPYYGYYRRGFMRLVVLLFIIVVIAIVAISVGLHYGTDSNDLDTPKEYSLTDKVIRSYKGDFCEGLQAVSTEIPNNHQSNATLYLLTSHPPLIGRERFNLSEKVNFDNNNNIHYWNFYLNTGSVLTINACYPPVSSYDVKFYLIKGSANYNRWTNDPHSSYAVKYVRLSLQCQTVTYRVQRDELYFFAFYWDPYFVSPSNTLDIEFQFDRTVYGISQDTVVKNCSIPLDGHSSCSLSVPMSSGYTALLSLNTSLPVDYNDGVNVQINCQPRGWLYAVIVVCSVVPVLVIITLVITWVCVRARKAKKYSALHASDSASVGTDESKGSGNVTTPESLLAPKSSSDSTSPANPPPFNPAYPPASGGYGATSVTGPPPPYT